MPLPVDFCKASAGNTTCTVLNSPCGHLPLVWTAPGPWLPAPRSARGSRMHTGRCRRMKPYSTPKNGFVSASLSAPPAPLSSSRLSLSDCINSVSSVFCWGRWDRVYVEVRGREERRNTAAVGGEGAGAGSASAKKHTRLGQRKDRGLADPGMQVALRWVVAMSTVGSAAFSLAYARLRGVGSKSPQHDLYPITYCL